MKKEPTLKKEWILNSATSRFQLTRKIKVGAVSEEIRKCAPKTLADWEEYYFNNVKTREHLINLGERLYVKITEVIPSEVEAITEEDCISYINRLVLNRTFDGYMTEITTIYGQLQDILKIKIEPAPDKWDRLFNVDFFIEIKGKYVGLQIKPAGNASHIPQIYKEREIQRKTHKKFTDIHGGKVFYIISIKENGKKKIANVEVIEEIKKEINRLA